MDGRAPEEGETLPLVGGTATAVGFLSDKCGRRRGMQTGVTTMKKCPDSKRKPWSGRSYGRIKLLGPTTLGGICEKHGTGGEQTVGVQRPGATGLLDDYQTIPVSSLDNDVRGRIGQQVPRLQQVFAVSQSRRSNEPSQSRLLAHQGHPPFELNKSRVALTCRGTGVTLVCESNLNCKGSRAHMTKLRNGTQLPNRNCYFCPTDAKAPLQRPALKRGKAPESKGLCATIFEIHAK